MNMNKITTQAAVRVTYIINNKEFHITDVYYDINKREPNPASIAIYIANVVLMYLNAEDENTVQPQVKGRTMDMSDKKRELTVGDVYGPAIKRSILNRLENFKEDLIRELIKRRDEIDEELIRLGIDPDD